jgi:hypothetical protein
MAKKKKVRREAPEPKPFMVVAAKSARVFVRKAGKVCFVPAGMKGEVVRVRADMGVVTLTVRWWRGMSGISLPCNVLERGVEPNDVHYVGLERPEQLPPEPLLDDDPF